MLCRRLFLGLIPKSVNNNCKNWCLPTVNQCNPTFSVFSTQYSQKKAIKCWQCGIERKNLNELFCEQCKFIQSPQNSDNYFKIFELDEQFDIDQKQLTQKYRKLQNLLHPDKFTNKSTEEKNISDDFSSLVNKAYNTLQIPLKRAVHLLNLKGVVIEEEQKVDDPAFLMEIMELNEEVENADTPEKLINLKCRNDSELAQISSEIKNAFDQDQTEKAKDLITKMKYYNSVSFHINNLMREKGIVE